MFQRTMFSWQHWAVVISEQTRLKFVSQWSISGSLFAVPHKNHFQHSLPDEFPLCAGCGPKYGAFIGKRATEGSSDYCPKRDRPCSEASLVLMTPWGLARGHLVFNQLGAGSSTQRLWASRHIHISRVCVCSAVIKQIGSAGAHFLQGLFTGVNVARSSLSLCDLKNTQICTKTNTGKCLCDQKYYKPVNTLCHIGVLLVESVK